MTKRKNKKGLKIDIREKVISVYPLTEKVTNLIKTIPCKRDAFNLTKSKCIIFHDDYIDTENIVDYVDKLNIEVLNGFHMDHARLLLLNCPELTPV